MITSFESLISTLEHEVERRTSIVVGLPAIQGVKEPGVSALKHLTPGCEERRMLLPFRLLMR